MPINEVAAVSSSVILAAVAVAEAIFIVCKLLAQSSPQPLKNQDGSVESVTMTQAARVWEDIANKRGNIQRFNMPDRRDSEKEIRTALNKFESCAEHFRCLALSNPQETSHWHSAAEFYDKTSQCYDLLKGKLASVEPKDDINLARATEMKAKAFECLAYIGEKTWDEVLEQWRECEKTKVSYSAYARAKQAECNAILHNTGENWRVAADLWFKTGVDAELISSLTKGKSYDAFLTFATSQAYWCLYQGGYIDLSALSGVCNMTAKADHRCSRLYNSDVYRGFEASALALSSISNSTLEFLKAGGRAGHLKCES